MKQNKKLEQYCKEMLLDYEIDGGLLSIQNKEYEILHEDVLIFDGDLEFLPNNVFEVDGWVYEFGGRWYLQLQDEAVSMDELRYKGKAVQKLPTKSFLGIHSGYELLNGMGLYGSWIKKAKFLGIEALGICEKKTLSGALVFQNECIKHGIKSIIGLAVPMQGELTKFDIKLYAKDFQGWQSLLKFTTELNVNGEPSINTDFLIKNKEGLYIIADPKSMDFKEMEAIKEHIDFYQLDTVNYINPDKDIDYINNLEKCIKSDLRPISITDAYYLEKDDWKTREVMWAVAKAFDDRTDNQYFKSNSEYAAELIDMFDKDEKIWIKLYKQASLNEEELVTGCNFKYDTDTRHLPKYIMTDWEKQKFPDNQALFLYLIRIGFKEKNLKDPQKYIDRLKVEIEVLQMGDVIDYFLSLYDIIRFSKKEGFLTGIGRGSAGGSLVAYLLGIIQINPLEFDLLFERFLNSGRMGYFEDRPNFELTLEDGTIVNLPEGSIARVIRDDKEKVIFIHDIIEGDDLIKY
jgi:DNA polymerase-3 subunit alpha